ncbi:hypothetical protein L596_012460 [Steinernema carpocapsae]|uniref:Uncharacterized protein n=1 Tax=Steinernema carpocapsae TaxID=34508 RepID=A0A4V6A4U5_STECR|nr:hypothetical protein L596_012460 [Steinernema carpocapsae]
MTLSGAGTYAIVLRIAFVLKIQFIHSKPLHTHVNERSLPLYAVSNAHVDHVDHLLLAKVEDVVRKLQKLRVDAIPLEAEVPVFVEFGRIVPNRIVIQSRIPCPETPIRQPKRGFCYGHTITENISS